MLVWTIWRSVWLVKCMNPAAGRPPPAGHWLGMKGGGAGTLGGGGGVCGRPTSEVDQVPTHRSPPLCAVRDAFSAHSTASAAAAASRAIVAVTVRDAWRDLMKTHSFRRPAGVTPGGLRRRLCA